MPDVFQVDAKTEDGDTVVVTVVCDETGTCTAGYLLHQDEYEDDWYTVEEFEHDDLILVGLDLDTTARRVWRVLPMATEGPQIADAVQLGILEGWVISLQDAEEELDQAALEMAQLDAAHTAGYLGEMMFAEGHMPMDWGTEEQWDRINDLGVYVVASAGDAWLVNDNYFVQNEMLGRGKTPSEGKDLKLWKDEDIQLLEERLADRGWERAPEFSIYDVFYGRDDTEAEVQADHVLMHLVDNLDWTEDWHVRDRLARSLNFVWDSQFGSDVEHVLFTVDVELEVWVPGPNATSIWDEAPEAAVAERKLKNRLLR